MKKDAALPERVFEHGRWYRLAVTKGVKREWHKLSLIRDGLPALWAAFNKFTQATDAPTMPALIADWARDVMSKKAPRTQQSETWMTKQIATAFAEFHPAEVKPTHCVKFLNQWDGKVRMYNRFRGMLGELFRYAMERGIREAGTNPVLGVIKTKSERARERCPTVRELRKVMIACRYAAPSKNDKHGPTLTATGPQMACLIELAYIHGQDIGVMIRLHDKPNPEKPGEPHLNEYGAFYRRDKTRGKVEFPWSPRLRQIVARLKKERAKLALKHPQTRALEPSILFRKQDGAPMTYEAAAAAWQRAIKLSGVLPFKFRDIRSRSLTDMDRRFGRLAANAAGTHTTEGQTAAYLRHTAARSGTPNA